LKNFFIRITLILLVGLSFFLSFFIWTNNRAFSGKTSIISNNNIATPVDHSHNLANLYNPIKILEVDGRGNKYILSDRVTDITESIKVIFNKLDLKRLIKYTADSNSQYENLLTSTDSIQLYYQAPISINILSDTFGFKYDSKIKDFSINRVIIRQISPIETEIYFANDKNLQYYYISLLLKKNHLFDIVSKIKNKILIKEERIGLSYLINYQNPISLKSYVYLVKTLDDSVFVSNFMTNDGSAGLTFDSKANIYKKGLTKSLTVNNETGLVHFIDYHLDSNQVPNGLTSLLKTSKDTMQKIDNSFNSFRYFAKTGKKHVVFRSYIDGFPVFYNEQKGDVSLLWQKNSQSFYFSNTTLEVPISTSQNSVTIETTNSLLQRLKNKGIKIRDIQDIQLGYSWVKNNDSVEVINLLPGYFIKIGGIYRDAATIINHQGGDNS